MRLEHLCDMELAYRTDFLLVRPYGGEEGTGYGEGDGRVHGGALTGTIRWANHPHRRTDGVMLPDAHGVITTDDGALIMFTLRGRTSFAGDVGAQLLWVTLEAEDERYRRFNGEMHVLEGVIDAQTLVMHAKVYTCVNELAPATG